MTDSLECFIPCCKTMRLNRVVAKLSYKHKKITAVPIGAVVIFLIQSTEGIRTRREHFHRWGVVGEVLAERDETRRGKDGVAVKIHRCTRPY